MSKSDELIRELCPNGVEYKENWIRLKCNKRFYNIFKMQVRIERNMTPYSIISEMLFQKINFISCSRHNLSP